MSYPPFYVVVDIFAYKIINNQPQLLLIQRKNDPFKGSWALPGGFVDLGDIDAEAAAKRELKEETGLNPEIFRQHLAFTKKGRDPRENNSRIFSIPFSSLLDSQDNPVASDDADTVKFFSIKELPDLAFDHKDIINMIIKDLKI